VSIFEKFGVVELEVTDDMIVDETASGREVNRCERLRKSPICSGSVAAVGVQRICILPQIYVESRALLRIRFSIATHFLNGLEPAHESVFRTHTF